MMVPRHIVVIGAGLAGLTASYDLLRAGQRVTLLEAGTSLGGLASSIDLEGHSVERFYHFICRMDHDLIRLIDELGIQDKLHWRQTYTSFYHDGRMYRFGSPADLLYFSPVPWIQRFRFGLHIMRSRYRKQWQILDQIAAKPWLIDNIGRKAYYVIWHPLLRIKFGDDYDKISAAWVWNRIWRVAQSRRRLWQRETFGYLEAGSATLVEWLSNWLNNQPKIRLLTGTKAQTIEIQGNRVSAVVAGGQRLECDAVISSVALPTLSKLLPEDINELPYITKLNQIKYIGVVCALYSLNQPYTNNFWLNINDQRISFNGIIEQTRLNQHLRQAGLNLVYIPYYTATNAPRYQYDDDRIDREYIAALKLVNPDFDESWVKERFVFRTPYAQAICSTDFTSLIPEIRSPLAGLYVTDSAQFYPEDRTLSAAISKGRQAARFVLEDFHDSDPGRL